MFNNSLINSSTCSPTQVSQENTASVPPSFLFANQNKRRSVALSNANPYLNSPLSYSGGPSTDIFASPTPIPAHVKESGGAPSSGKSVHWSPNVVDDSTHRSLSRLGSGSVTKGPPLRSLREDVESPATKQPRIPSSAPSALAGKDSPAGADHWVTVFGFPPNFTDKVIKLMSRHGEIVSQQVPSRGNWINLRYSCAVHAEQAMGRNAFLIDGVVRIGVVPCTDTEAMESANRSVLNLSRFEDAVEEDSSRRTLPPPMAPTDETSFNASMLNTSVRETSVSRAGSFRSSSRAGMRSLAATTRHNDSVKGSEPTKDGGLMGRLWSLVG